MLNHVIHFQIVSSIMLVWKRGV